MTTRREVLTDKLRGYAELGTKYADENAWPRAATRRQIRASMGGLLPGLALDSAQWKAVLDYAEKRGWAAQRCGCLFGATPYRCELPEGHRGSCMQRGAQGLAVGTNPADRRYVGARDDLRKVKGGARKGAGRPQHVEKATNHTMRFRASTWRLLARLAKHRGVSRQTLIAELAEAEALRVKEETR